MLTQGMIGYIAIEFDDCGVFMDCDGYFVGLSVRDCEPCYDGIKTRVGGVFCIPWLGVRV